MDVLVENLHPDAGLKFNKTVILGKQDIKEFISNNREHFINLNLKYIDESSMMYGYDIYTNPLKIVFQDDLIQLIVIVTDQINQIRFKAILSYDGHLYNGFQIQKDQPTIQGELTRVISNINGYETLVQGCSRTDTGVHANHYVIHFDSDRDIGEARWLELLNHQLPKDILIKDILKTHPLFHSRYDVTKKRYLYRIKLRERDPFHIHYQWNISGWNLDILNENLKQLVGTHDFISFCKGTPESSVRTIYVAQAILNDDELILEFEGNGFLRYMIRIIVYALYMISSNQLDLTISDLIKEKSRKHTKHLAPASGLYLDQVYY